MQASSCCLHRAQIFFCRTQTSSWSGTVKTLPRTKETFRLEATTDLKDTISRTTASTGGQSALIQLTKQNLPLPGVIDVRHLGQSHVLSLFFFFFFFSSFFFLPQTQPLLKRNEAQRTKSINTHTQTCTLWLWNVTAMLTYCVRPHVYHSPSCAKEWQNGKPVSDDCLHGTTLATLPTKHAAKETRRATAVCKLHSLQKLPFR